MVVSMPQHKYEHLQLYAWAEWIIGLFSGTYMYLINKVADDAYAYNGAISQEEQNLLFCLYCAPLSYCVPTACTCVEGVLTAIMFIIVTVKAYALLKTRA